MASWSPPFRTWKRSRWKNDQQEFFHPTFGQLFILALGMHATDLIDRLAILGYIHVGPSHCSGEIHAVNDRRQARSIMTVSAVLAILAIFLVVAVILARPFMEPLGKGSSQDPAQADLLEQRGHILTALQDLDADHALGKVGGQEYAWQRAALLQRGAGILRQIDALGSRSNKKTQSSAAGSSATDEQLEDLIAGRRSVRRQKTAGFCPKCGKMVLVSDDFCPHCGYSLKKKEG